MNTKAQIARLRAEAELFEAHAWDLRVEALDLEDGTGFHVKGFAISCRERAAAYIQDAQKSEAGPNLASSNHPTNEAV